MEPQRLSLTCERLKCRLMERQGGDALALAPLRALLHQAPTNEPSLTLIQAGVGTTLHMVSIADVHYFEADSKYVRVVTQERSLLIRTPLRELAPRLDPHQFMQIHRSIVVRTSLIDKVIRHEAGKVYLYLKGRGERLVVSRTYVHQFKPM